ncbi:MAG: radical SAM protein [Candidatus Thorarchaeota archaeon]
MKYVYGPVPSRRLGRSLGIDPIPLKTCNYQCIYCQLGKTTYFTNERKNFFPVKAIICELKKAIKENEGNFDYITFVGSGEPTLYKDLKKLILMAKELSEIPICVITNGSLLYDKEIRDILISADVILPSLDAGDEKSFIKINRPHPSINFEKLIQGFIDFREIYKGKFWIEVMLIKDMNDSKEELIKIKKKIDLIKPSRIDFNIPIRPPVEEWVKIPEENIISLLNEIFADYNNIFYPEKGPFRVYSKNFEKELLAIIERHPMTQEQILQTFSNEQFTKNKILSQLDKLTSLDKIRKIIYNNQTFYSCND